MGYGKLLNIANTEVTLRAALRLAMNVYDNPDELVDVLFEKYPAMTSSSTQERTEAAGQLFTDFLFASGAYNEAHNHALYANTSCLLFP